MLPSRHYFAGALGLAFVLLLCGLAASLADTRGPGASVPGPQNPQLAVLLVFDQLRGDYFERWRSLFVEGGFRRLMKEGAWFRKCNYPYSDTFTAAGHASVVTGCSPNRNGLISNEWYDRQAGAVVYCVGADRYDIVPPRPSSAGKKPRGISPEKILTPTLADTLKDATGGKGRVVSLSLKDRSAVLPGGRRPDACYWFDTGTGRFETSTYYGDTLHHWVASVNRERLADQWRGMSWDRLREDLDYLRYSGPDDVVGEGVAPVAGRTFPHRLGGPPTAPGSSYYNALFNSPFGNDLLAEVVRRAVIGESLGSRPTPDLLCVSFSSNDGVGHVWGPDSQEVLDTTLRTDRLLAALLTFLDERVGKGRYLVALTADHGVCPLPEVSRAQGRAAWRPMMSELKRGAEEHLREKFGGEQRERWVEGTAENWFWLDLRTISRHGLKESDVETALAGWATKQPGIQAAYTRTELLTAKRDDPVFRQVLRSFYAARSGDVAILPQPYSVLWVLPTGTTHGTPYAYDTHVPLLVAGPGVRPGERSDAVTPLATAAILAHALGIKPPGAAEEPLPEGLFVQTGRSADDPAIPSGRGR
jgi:predicted AlkP superfamily pyrophosphatase or phosphodiesterase